MTADKAADNIRVVDNDVLIGEFAYWLSQGKSVKFRPKGRSMYPFICPERGDRVVIAPPVETLKVGQIVLARVGERYFLHRIESIDGERLTMRGDGNVHGHERCRVGDVIGVVTRCERNDRTRMVYGTVPFVWTKLRFMRRWLLAAMRIVGIIP